MVDALADMTSRLHALPVDECPFDRTLRVTGPLARAAAAAGEVDLEDLDADRQGWSIDQLVAARLLPAPGRVL